MTITKRNGKFYCRFQIDGERHHFLCQGATTIKEAEKLESQFKFKLQQQQNGVIPKDNETKLLTLIRLYDNYSKNNKKSYKNFDVPAMKYIGNYFGLNTKMKDIKYSNLESFKKKMIDRGLSPSTINKHLNVISKMCNLAIAEKLITENPVSGFKRMKERNYKVRFLTKDEEIRLFSAIDKYAPYIKPIIITALQTGMRKSEILNLKWSNIDFDYGFIELLETKSGRSRKIPISDTLLEVLNSLKSNFEYVFVNPDTGKPYVDIHKSWETALEKAKIENFRFHDLRHTVATRLVESGVDLVVVKDILGHSKIETTMRYAHPVPKRKLDAIAVLNSYH